MFDIQKIEAAIHQISAERKIDPKIVVEIIESAIKTAYKKDYGTKDDDVRVTLDLKEGTLEIVLEKTVVNEVENPSLEVSLEDLGGEESGFEVGDRVEIDVTDDVMSSSLGDSFGRIASQAAKQVIIQKIGESEKQKIYDLFKDKVGEVISMKVSMVEANRVIFDYNGNQVILPRSEQVSRDHYVPDSRFYLYVSEVSVDEKTGPKVVLSRKNRNIVPAIFALFVPEVEDGLIEIEDVVRYPGVKTKILVSSDDPDIDPAGSMIGQKGMRVKAVMEELSGEKIDIIVNDGDLIGMVKKSLAPAEVLKVEIDEEENQIKAHVVSTQRAKAIGKNGVNIHLASRLLGYEISLVEVLDQEENEE